MNDSFDDAIANMEMPEDPGPSADIKSATDKPDEKHTLPSSSSTTKLSATTKRDNAATIHSKHAIQVNPNQKGNPVLKAIVSIPYEFNDILADYEIGAHGEINDKFLIFFY
jgi:DNA excision repair protein ERCC-1